MTNHPSRGWRARAARAAEDYAIQHAAPASAVAGMITRGDLARVQIAAYIAGYAAGRESAQRKQRKQP